MRNKLEANRFYGKVGRDLVPASLVFHPGSDAMYLRLEAEERRQRELRATHVIYYDDGDSVVIGKKIAPTFEEANFDRDRGAL